MNELALFAGAGGGILGGKLLGWTTKCAVEIDPYCRSVLLARQRDGILEPFPIWDDVTTFSGTEWRGHIDVVSGGFPCQDISAAGQGKGIGGERSGLWSHMARIIGEVQPRYVLVENSPLLTSRGLDVVLADLAAMGFDAEWGVVSAENAGAPHKRERIWVLAYSEMRDARQPEIKPGTNRQESNSEKKRTEFRNEFIGCGQAWWDEDPADVADSDNAATTRQRKDGGSRNVQPEPTGHGVGSGSYRICSTESRLGRVADGVAHRVDRLKAIGNGQVSSVAALAWEILSGKIDTQS